MAVAVPAAKPGTAEGQRTIAEEFSFRVDELVGQSNCCNQRLNRRSRRITALNRPVLQRMQRIIIYPLPVLFADPGRKEIVGE